jgi:ArsR family transcriptional regulator, arsenate/arsenite/antimonite-responsive transcriptional repressor
MANDSCVVMFKALSDETRQKIVRMLKSGSLSVNEIVEKTALAQPTISHHLGILKTAGVVVTQRKGKQVLYSLCCGPEAWTCCADIFSVFGMDLAAKEEEIKG